MHILTAGLPAHVECELRRRTLAYTTLEGQNPNSGVIRRSVLEFEAASIRKLNW